MVYAIAIVENMRTCLFACLSIIIITTIVIVKPLFNWDSLNKGCLANKETTFESQLHTITHAIMLKQLSTVHNGRLLPFFILRVNIYTT